MSRIFEFDNKNEIKLELEGFDRAPILIGNEKSTGEVSLENLSKFAGCNLSMKSVNVKNELGEVVELKTYYTVAQAADNMYNNDIIHSLKREDDAILVVEVCLGKGEYKRYEILEYPCTYNMIEISKKASLDIYNKFVKKQEDDNEDSGNDVNRYAKITFYDVDGFESVFNMRLSDVSDSILSIRIVASSNENKSNKVSRKAKKVFQTLKQDGKNKVESISNYTSTVIKALSLKKKA